MIYSFVSTLAALLLATCALGPASGVSATPTPEPGLTIPILSPLLNLLNNPPPKILRTTTPSPQCAAVNHGELMCCRAMVAGDLQLVVWLSALYGYQLNPNDINGLNCDSNIDSCPGVKVCCQTTVLAPLLALWCQDLP